MTYYSTGEHTMKKTFLLSTLLVAIFGVSMVQAKTDSPIRLVIHGGAGTITKSTITSEQEKAYQEALTEALTEGYEVLNNGGSSLDAVQKAIIVLENSPLFNAGKGAVFTHEGRNEMDASIMDGKTLNAGAVAGVTTIKNPILAANLVMTKSPHVMMVTQGAEKFAQQNGLEIVAPEYFYTDFRWQQLQAALKDDKMTLEGAENIKANANPMLYDYKFGTVGAVALDKSGNLAAGTSTGGMTNKRYGRVGDSPIIGAGTYADNDSVAVSATGSGEKFIRTVTAYNIAAQVKYAGSTIEQAADNALNDVKAIDGEGGVIVLDKKGNYTTRFNSEGMYRGTIGDDGIAQVAIYR